MRYTEKEYTNENKDILSFYKNSISHLLGSFLRLVNEISSKIAYLGKDLVVKILLGCCIIITFDVIATSVILLSTGRFSLTTGAMPLMSKLIGLGIFMAIVVIMVNTKADFVDSLVSKGVYSNLDKDRVTEKKYHKPVSNTKTSTKNVNKDVSRSKQMKSDEKLTNQEPSKQTKDNISTQELSSEESVPNSTVTSVDIQLTDIERELQLLSRELVINDELDTSVVSSLTSDNYLDLGGHSPIGFDVSFDIGGMSSYTEEVESEPVVDTSANSLDDNEDFRDTFGSRPDISINEVMYYCSNVIGYHKSKYAISPKRLMRKNAIFREEELSKLDDTFEANRKTSNEFTEKMSQLFDEMSIVDDWASFT